MDRPLDPKYRNWKIIRRISAGLLITAAFVLAGILLTGWIKPSVHRDRIRTAIVETGPVEETINASGTVVPEYEQVIACPVDTRVLAILAQPGTAVQTGDPIVRLDIDASRTALEKLKDQLAIKENQQRKARLDLANRLIELKGDHEVKQLELKSLEFRLNQSRTLFEKGLISENDLRQVELSTESTRIALRKIEEAQQNAERVTETELESLHLEIGMLRKDVLESERQLGLATASAERPGVITWVTPDIGASITRGATLARVADLSSFRVEATVSDIHAADLMVGLPVRVRFDETYLDGTVARIRPAVENGIITLDVTLFDPANEHLHPNLRVDVFIVTEREPNTLRLKRGPAIDSPELQDVFVIRGRVAVRMGVQLGIRSFDYVAIKEGLVAGDEVILSDMSDYLHVRELDVK